RYFRNRKGRIGLERKEIEEDRATLHTDREILHEETVLEGEARKLFELFNQLSQRAIKIKLNNEISVRRKILSFIMNNLRALSRGEAGFGIEEGAVRRTNDAINIFLNGFPVQDREINAIVSEIRKLQTRVFGDIVRERGLLERKLRALKQEVGEVESEFSNQ
ncbi:hypothetical protein HYT54_03695, partial [Candidatus Woesearchaeota archaeon]|nr:hypothetical protein [Candidatus Woesearchaeota archaeon]